MKSMDMGCGQSQQFGRFSSCFSFLSNEFCRTQPGPERTQIMINVIQTAAQSRNCAISQPESQFYLRFHKKISPMILIAAPPWNHNFM
jgi:hypothetical protein